MKSITLLQLVMKFQKDKYKGTLMSSLVCKPLKLILEKKNPRNLDIIFDLNFNPNFDPNQILNVVKKIKSKNVLEY
jgi:hypothetical protein